MQLWSTMHLVTLLPAICFFIAMGILLGHILKDKDEKIKNIPFQIISILIICLEIAKQIVSIAYGYDLYHLPFHFCSLLLFFLPLFAFYKGKHLDSIKTITATICTLATLVAIIYPNIVYEESSINYFFKNFLCFHSVFFHNLIVFTFILMLTLKKFSFSTKKDILGITISCLLYSLVAGTMAQLLKTNFNSFYFFKLQSIENIRLQVINSLGVFGQILYIAFISVALIIGMIVSYYIFRFFVWSCGKIKNIFYNQKPTTN